MVLMLWAFFNYSFNEGNHQVNTSLVLALLVNPVQYCFHPMNKHNLLLPAI